MGGKAAEVALFSSFAEAAATVASSLPTGRVVVPATEFRSNFLPWAMLSRRGFEVVEVAPRVRRCARGRFSRRSCPAPWWSRCPRRSLRTVFASTWPKSVRAAARSARGSFLDLTQTLGVLRFDAATAGA
ncbi:MAG: hypothetical protein HC897_17955 [Thermoanaerobaculia bacterium]|nr:hypothetical protein [Thermoanaerobaculia bacterium]